MIDVRVDIVRDDDDPRLALPFVACQVGGRALRAVLDSGAARTTLVGGSHRLSIEASSVAEGKSTFGASQSVHQRRLPVHFAGMDLRPLEVAVVPAGTPGHGDLLGQDVLSLFRCEYRLWEGRLRLDAPLPEGAQPIHLDTGKHLYLEPAWADDARANAVFDTGASVTVVDARCARAHPALFEPVGTGERTDASGASVKTAMALMAGHRIFDYEFADTLVASVDLSAANQDLKRHMDIILGWPVIRQATWTFDHDDAKVSISKPAP